MLWPWNLQLQVQIFELYLLVGTDTKVEHAFSVGGKASNDLGNALMGDAAERFGMREAQKFRFLGE